MKVNINKNMVSKLASCVLCGTLAGVSLSACLKPNTNIYRDTIFLKDTRLENAYVFTLDDGSKDIGVSVGNCSSGDGLHFYSVVTGEYFADDTCLDDEIEGNPAHKYKFEDIELITEYLTTEEYAKVLLKGKLDNDDTNSIVGRVLMSSKKETNSKIK